MEQFLKDWWAVIIAFLAGGAWVGKIQRDVSELQKDPCVTEARCSERQKALEKNADLQFKAGNAQFSEIKVMISELQRSHNELIKTILERK